MHAYYVVVWVDSKTLVPFGVKVFMKKENLRTTMELYWHAGVDFVLDDEDKMFGKLLKCDDLKSCYIFPG